MKWLCAVMVICLCSCAHTSHLYIVRHAEKAANDPKDPDLTSAGIERANILALLLRSKEIKKIYATDYKRTKATAKPLSDATRVPVEIYKNDTIGTMLRHLVQSGSNALIVGHSNTALSMLDSLHLMHHKKLIPDNEYNNLFIVTVKKGQVINLKEQHYGSGS